MTNEELKQLHSIINDLWQYIKKYADVKDTDEYWEQMFLEANEIGRRHGDHELCVQLLITSMKWMEGKVKAK